MVDTSAILRYLKVKALADQGAPGEQTNARRILNKMERDHPGIRDAAQRYKEDQEREEAEPDGYPAHYEGGFGGNWENIFEFAAQAAGYAYTFAQSAVNAQHGRWLAAHVDTYTRKTATGNTVIGIRMPEEIQWQAQQMNPFQKQMFCQALHELLDDQLAVLLDDSSQEEEEEEGGFYW